MLGTKILMKENNLITKIILNKLDDISILTNWRVLRIISISVPN